MSPVLGMPILEWRLSDASRNEQGLFADLVPQHNTPPEWFTRGRPSLFHAFLVWPFLYKRIENSLCFRDPHSSSFLPPFLSSPLFTALLHTACAMSIDFLSSDIVFPSDSTESKLAARSFSKLPDPVDWAFHDYYSTACEKVFAPIQSLTDLRKLDPVPQEPAVEGKPISGAVAQLDVLQQKLKNQDPQSLVFMLSNDINKNSPAAVPPRSNPDLPVPNPPDHQQNLRAALRGALEIVENDMQDNHLMRVKRGEPASSDAAKSESWTWKDDLVHSSINGISGPSTRTPSRRQQPIEDDEDLDFLYDRVPSPAYDTINENPILLDSSVVASHISSSIAMQEDCFLPAPVTTPPPAATATAAPVYKPIYPASPSNQATQHQHQQHQKSSRISVSTKPEHQSQDRSSSIAKSKAWQGLVSRLKKNLGLPLTTKSKQQEEQQPKEESGQQRRFQRLLKLRKF